MSVESNSVKVVEEWVTRPGGAEIYTKKWMSVIEPPIATVVLLHGFGEHVNRYNHVFDKFALKGVEVFGFDQRGFGQTAFRDKRRGHTGGWKVVNEDITAFLIANKRPNVPQFLFGHSMGGGLAANYASEGPERNNLAGIVLSAPLIDLAPQSRIPKSAIVLGNAISKVAPNLTIPVNLNKNYISRDPKEVERYTNDPLVHGFGSLRGIVDLVYGVKSVLNVKYKNITLPVYICFGTGDGINSCDVAREFFKKLPSENKTWREWPDGYHELHNEDNREMVIDHYLNWILKVAASSPNSNNNKISASSSSTVSSTPLALASI